jgi:hypothetical protein
MDPIPAQVVDVLVPCFVSFSLPIVADVAFIIVKNFTFPLNNLLDLRSSEREVTSPSNLKVVGALDNYSLVFIIFI